jgi:hypothetical protein
MQQLGYNSGNGVFLCGPWRNVISKGQSSVENEFCTGGCEERTRAREAEGSPLLGAVARERLVKTAGWKRLSGCCGDLWRLVVAL